MKKQCGPAFRCIGQIDGEYLAKMEDVLLVYNRPIDAKRPRLCFDERPCQLLDDVVVGLRVKPGKAAKEDNDGAARAVRQARHGSGLASL